MLGTQVQSTRMPISDQDKGLVKNCLEGGGSMSPLQPLVYILDLE